jgi:hypothetical protein
MGDRSGSANQVQRRGIVATGDEHYGHGSPDRSKRFVEALRLQDETDVTEIPSIVIRRIAPKFACGAGWYTNSYGPRSCSVMTTDRNAPCTESIAVTRARVAPMLVATILRAIRRRLELAIALQSCGRRKPQDPDQPAVGIEFTDVLTCPQRVAHRGYHSPAVHCASVH